jgi:TPP-dependent pyruvate/acetoin dehydrogenase alpha subunit
MALEMEVEMEQRVSDFVKKREKEMISNLEKQLTKRGGLSKNETSEMLKTMESEIKVKMEAALLDARQRVMERS